jgi:hypothetical protein
MVTEDGTESDNVFDHNFAMRSAGSGDFAPRSGYGGPGPDPGGEGAGFWFRGPNNYIRNNVAANADVFGFGLAAGALGEVRIPLFKGAATSEESETKTLDTTGASVLEFYNNEAYGAMQTGVAMGWNGVLKNSVVWHASRNAMTATPADTLTIENATIRGDREVLSDEFEAPAGVWVDNYLSKTVAVKNVNVVGLRTGVSSPFFRGDQKAEPGRGNSSITIEHSFFRNYVGVSVGTSYRTQSVNDKPLKTAVVRDSSFATLEQVPVASTALPAAISMNYRMAP